MSTECPSKKVKFASEEYATFIINKRKPLNDAKGLVARAYKCNLCSSWHITSKKSVFKEVEELKEKIKELEGQLEESKEDSTALKEQLVEYIKKNVDQKAEIDILRQFKDVNKSLAPDARILKHQLNQKNKKLAEQTKQINTLLAKLKSL